MLKRLINSMDYGELLDMIYTDASGVISQRRMQVLQVGDNSFRAYCFLRKSKRTFRVDNILALVPVIQKESMVI